MDGLILKRKEVLEAIKPICEAYGIEDYDYIVSEKAPREILRIYDTKIGCSDNPIFAIKQKLTGWIFINMWKGRGLGCFDTQTKNVIKRYWIEG